MTAIESVDEPKAPVTSSTDDEPKRKPRRRREPNSLSMTR